MVTILIAAPCGRVRAASNVGQPNQRLGGTAQCQAGDTASQRGCSPTAHDVAAFMDELFPDALARGGIPAAVVVVVSNGRVLFARGYGSADGKPVDPGRTLFRPGSISKTITWTAVMQLVAAGKLDLDRDINSYLDFRIADTFHQPITLRHLLTHTSGLADAVKNIDFTEVKGFPSNEQFLKAWTPTRLYPPGTVVAYSNYGAALAGYIVQRVSGEDFERYVERHVFEPLAMTRSSFRQPLPGDLAREVTPGYRTATGRAEPFELIAPAPAGGLSATALDMAHFMIAHLQQGRYGDESILDAATVDMMQATAYRPVPPLNAMALGFYHEDRNGQRIIGHAGGTAFFHSDMHLFPDAGIGIFVSMNSGGVDNAADTLRRTLLVGFTDRYFPVVTPREPTVPTAFVHASMATGRYLSSQRSGETFGSFLDLFNQTRLTMNADGTIELDRIRTPRGEALRWHEIGPFVWRVLGGSDRLAMRVENGRVIAIYSDYFAPSSVFLPVSPWHSAIWNVPLLLGALCILCLAVLQWPAEALVRYIARKKRGYSGGELIRYRLVRLACLANLLFIGGLLAFIVTVIQPGRLPLTSQIDPWLRLFQGFGLIGLAGTGIAIYAACAEWAAGGSWRRRISSALIAGACLAGAWFGLGFHLLSGSLNF
jgi:CubicO group peptidase (beta-lactamase class C family)